METASGPVRREPERIRGKEDWQRLRTVGGIRTVVDPMVFRTAELFFRGRAPAHAYGPGGELDPSTVWTALESNVDSLMTFVDCLVLNERLPMFDYGVTFRPDLDAGQLNLLDACNRNGELLVAVTVLDRASRAKALETLAGQNPIPESVRNELLRHLAAYEWDWRLDLDTGAHAVSSEPLPARQRLDAFRYGGLLFSGYAQQLRGEHVMQPKRARLYLQGALAGVSPLETEVEAVFAGLLALARALPAGLTRAHELPRIPTFLPYVLQDSGVKEPIDLLDRLLKLRDEKEVRAYRDWWLKLLASLAEGIFPTGVEQELRELEADLEAQLQQPAVRGRTGGVVTVSPEDSHGQDAVAQAGLALPGEGEHRKVLLDLLLADRAVYRPERRLEKLWKGEEH
jgi:hypothetical protein